MSRPSGSAALACTCDAALLRFQRYRLLHGHRAKTSISSMPSGSTRPFISSGLRRSARGHDNSVPTTACDVVLGRCRENSPTHLLRGDRRGLRGQPYVPPPPELKPHRLSRRPGAPLPPLSTRQRGIAPPPATPPRPTSRVGTSTAEAGEWRRCDRATTALPRDTGSRPVRSARTPAEAQTRARSHGVGLHRAASPFTLASGCALCPTSPPPLARSMWKYSRDHQ